MPTKRHSIAILLSGTKMPRGGLTSSALNRATQLSKRGYDVQVYTFDYRPDFADHVTDLRDQGLLGQNVAMHNFYDCLRKNRTAVDKRCEVAAVESADLVQQRESKRLTRYFTARGQFVYSELYGEGRSLWRRYYSDSRVEKRRVEYSLKGTLHRETVFADNSPNVSCFSYLDEYGCAYFTQWMDTAGKPVDVFVADNVQSAQYTRFNSLIKAQENWFHSAVSELPNPVTVMIDDCTMAPVTSNLQSADTQMIAIFHNDHNTPAHKSMIEAMDSWHAVVCSTQGQAQALREVVPQSLEIISIPQPIPDRAAEIARTQRRAAARFAYFGRLSERKNIIPLVRCFQQVVESLPDASLDIYGSGPQEAEIRRLIGELRLQQNVRLMGRTDSPVTRMAEYSAVVLASAYEGFGLVIGESMLAETPVVAFDCDFGPRDIINHGVNGLLVEAGNFMQLAEQMVSFSHDLDAARSMGSAGRKSVLERFNNERITGLWEELIGELAS